MTFRAVIVFVVLLSGNLWASEDALFLSAQEAHQQGDAERLNRLAPELQSHILAPYVAFWQLKMGPSERSPAEWQQFMARYPDSLIGQRARGNLLRSLAKAEQWGAVEREAATYELDDPEVRCLVVRARILRQDPDAVNEAKQLWVQPAITGDACTELFEHLIRTRALKEADLWQRIRAVLETNNTSAAQHLFNYLTSSARPTKKEWEALNRNPHRYLQQKALKLKNRTDRELATFALFRTALSLPELAHERWLQIKGRYPSEERGYAWAQLAAAGAFKHRPEALNWYKEAGAYPLSERQLAWKVRAGIRASNWEAVASAIDGMNDKDRQIPTWRYWRARAFLDEGRLSDANMLLAPLSIEHNFYGQLAAEELDTYITELPANIEITEEDVQAIAQNPGLRRALKLFELGQRNEGVLEWRWSIRPLDDRQLLAAAELAQRSGWFDRTIDTAERTKQTHNFRLRFPMPYRDVFAVYSERQNLDQAWVYGLVRQESRFSPQIRSSAGAMGLMQLMPSTASQVARRAGLGRVDRTAITAVETNVSLGTYHLRELMELLDSKPMLASAAYNAGLSRVRDWQPPRSMEGVAFAETIPFSETRDYVKKVMSNTMYYARILGQKFVPLKNRLGTINGRLMEP